MHLVQTMAYVDEAPWHGLGNRLSPTNIASRPRSTPAD